MSVIAVFIALGGSALAVQVAKKNSVTSKSIRNNAVRSADLRNEGVKAVDIRDGQVGSAEIGDGQVGSADVGDGQIGSSEVADGSLSAVDINVGSLGDATSGRSDSNPGAVCIQTATSYSACVNTQVTLEQNGRIYATVDGNADSGAVSVSVGVNTCRLTVDGNQFTDDFVIAANFSPGTPFSFASVTETLAPGIHTIRFDCHGNGTLPGPRIFFPTLTTLELGSG